jgi:nitroreductase
MKVFLKKVMPRSLVSFLKRLKEIIELSSLRWAPRHKLLSGFYYFVVSGFSNEHQAVLKGRKAYYESLKDIGETCALLRRNIHRLEKGLIMQPRRDVFAEGFIHETVDCYKDAIVSHKLADSEKKWAKDVLDEYFNVAGSTSTIDTARLTHHETRKFTLASYETKAPLLDDTGLFKPYKYNKLPENKVSFENLKDLFLRRRSVRWYRSKEVPLELVQKAANIASYAPSACNRQPYKFFFCNDKPKTVAIARCAGGTVGFAENLPSIIAVVGDLSAYPHERDRHLIYIDGSLASMQLMLALEALGLSSCAINWPEVNKSEKEIRHIIDLKDYERVVMLIAVGYADEDGGIPYSQKKQDNLILKDIS